MSAIACENISRLHSAENLVSGTSHKDQIVEKENYCFLFHARIDTSIQIHSLGEMLHCDGSHRLKTYQPELLVLMQPSMPDADLPMLPLPAIHRMKHLLCRLYRYCLQHFSQASQLYHRYQYFHQ